VCCTPDLGVASAEPLGASTESGASPHVLLIDDRVAPHDAFVRLLEIDGFAVTCASTGTLGLALASTMRWQALLLDLHLPDLPGLAVLSRLRAANDHVPVIVMTGWYGDGEHETAAHALGATAFLRHPIDAGEVASRLRTVIRHPELTASAPPTGCAPRGAPLTAAERVMIADVVEVLLPVLNRNLRRTFPGVDADYVADAVADALLDLRRCLPRFDPTRGVSFTRFLNLAAHRNLLDRLAKDRRRGRWHEQYAWCAPRAIQCDECQCGHADSAAITTALREAGILKTDADAATLRLWLDGERRTAVFATAVGVCDLPEDQQRRTVKRVKDRVLQRLRRLNQSATRKKGCGAEGDVPAQGRLDPGSAFGWIIGKALGKGGR
jgi:CheY-like chemotaxis protein